MDTCDACGEGGVPLKCCAKCRDAWYCSKKCQREAWKDHHRAECEGYCSEDCRLADCAKISSRHARHRVCRVCGKFSKYFCARCNEARYCSQACQIQDWRSGHKQACKSEDDDDILTHAQENIATRRSARSSVLTSSLADSLNASFIDEIITNGFGQRSAGSTW